MDFQYWLNLYEQARRGSTYDAEGFREYYEAFITARNSGERARQDSTFENVMTFTKRYENLRSRQPTVRVDRQVDRQMSTDARTPTFVSSGYVSTSAAEPSYDRPSFGPPAAVSTASEYAAKKRMEQLNFTSGSLPQTVADASASGAYRPTLTGTGAAGSIGNMLTSKKIGSKPIFDKLNELKVRGQNLLIVAKDLYDKKLVWGRPVHISTVPIDKDVWVDEDGYVVDRSHARSNLNALLATRKHKHELDQFGFPNKMKGGVAVHVSEYPDVEDIVIDAEGFVRERPRPPTTPPPLPAKDRNSSIAARRQSQPKRVIVNPAPRPMINSPVGAKKPIPLLDVTSRSSVMVRTVVNRNRYRATDIVYIDLMVGKKLKFGDIDPRKLPWASTFLIDVTEFGEVMNTFIEENGVVMTVSRDIAIKKLIDAAR